jgi:hypothetical protein
VSHQCLALTFFFFLNLILDKITLTASPLLCIKCVCFSEGDLEVQHEHPTALSLPYRSVTVTGGRPHLPPSCGFRLCVTQNLEQICRAQRLSRDHGNSPGTPSILQEIGIYDPFHPWQSTRVPIIHLMY